MLKDIPNSLEPNKKEKVKLSKREKECLALLAHGKKIKEIAHILVLSPRTVEHYFNLLKLKLDLNKSQLIDYYWKNEFLRFSDGLEYFYNTKERAIPHMTHPICK